MVRLNNSASPSDVIEVDKGFFYKELEEKSSRRDVEIVKKFESWVSSLPEEIRRLIDIRGSVHRQRRTATLWPYIKPPGYKYFPFGFRRDGTVEVAFQWLRGGKRPPFNKEEVREELADRLNRLFRGENVPEIKPKGRPTFPISILGDEDIMKGFHDVFLWVIKKIRVH